MSVRPVSAPLGKKWERKAKEGQSLVAEGKHIETVPQKRRLERGRRQGRVTSGNCEPVLVRESIGKKDV